jgi:hypothetical protein
VQSKFRSLHFALFTCRERFRRFPVH